VKILQSDFSDDETLAERFRREALACSRLQHENVVYVTDFSGHVLRAMSVPARRQFVADFQSPGGPPFAVLTTGVGGSGLTLTQANHVVHFDRPWNPSVERQAEGRAYRIGQGKDVHVHTLVAQGTVDERIRDLLEHRSALADLVLETPDPIRAAQLSNADLIDFVQFRAA
jgi:non-specific serine/threonine protein kinase